MLAYASVLHLTICQIMWSLWRGTRGLTKSGLKFRDTVWVERHHKDVLSRHRQASWYVPGVIVWKVGQDVYAVRVGDTNILDRDHTQLRPREPDPSGRPVTFEFTARDLDSDDEGEELQF